MSILPCQAAGKPQHSVSAAPPPYHSGHVLLVDFHKLADVQLRKPQWVYFKSDLTILKGLFDYSTEYDCNSESILIPLRIQ